MQVVAFDAVTSIPSFQFPRAMLAPFLLFVFFLLGRGSLLSATEGTQQTENNNEYDRLLPPQFFYVNVDAYEEECFFERVLHGDQFRMKFMVTEGGFQDIDFSLTDPSGTVATFDKLSEKLVSLNITQDGVVTYCFNNKMSTLTVKTIRVGLFVRNPEAAQKLLELRQATSLPLMVSELQQMMENVALDFGILASIKANHFKINARTNTWINWWAIFESLLLFGMSAWQVYYVKRFFEVRRFV